MARIGQIPPGKKIEEIKDMSRSSEYVAAVIKAAALAAVLAPTALYALTPDFAGTEGPAVLKSSRRRSAIAKDFKLANEGALTIATTPSELPLDAYATDTKTAIKEPDIAQLIADSLALKLELVRSLGRTGRSAWRRANSTQIISNVTVTEARKEKFDFSTYRHDVLGFYVKADNKTIESIAEPKDIAGLKVIVSSGTSQEQILLNWAKKNKEAGLPTEIQYYDDSAVRHLALESGRADADLEPNATEAFYAVQNGKTRLSAS